jgi:hypothetical protein
MKTSAAAPSAKPVSLTTPLIMRDGADAWMIHFGVVSSRARLLVLAGIVAALAIAILVAVLATGGEAATGIRGTVVSGCVRPPPPLPACPERPFSARQRAVPAVGGGAPVEFGSNEDGSFKVELDPGRYVIEALPNQGFVGRLRPTQVQVKDSGFTPVRLFYDTGLG